MAILTGMFVAKFLAGAVAVLTSFRYGAGLYAYRQTELLERPDYTIIRQLSDGIEIRHYEPYLIAETTVDGSGFREPTGNGFRSCAGYIFGKNKKRRGGWYFGGSSNDTSEKMAMTAPVRVDGNMDESKRTKVSFVIGKKYSLKTAPVPMDKNVKLRQVPAHTLAVRTFSGPPPKDDRVQKERQKIEVALEKAGMALTTTAYSASSHDTTLVYGYHDPFITPNFLRRNEVAVVIDGSV